MHITELCDHRPCHLKTVLGIDQEDRLNLHKDGSKITDVKNEYANLAPEMSEAFNKSISSYTDLARNIEKGCMRMRIGTDQFDETTGRSRRDA